MRNTYPYNTCTHATVMGYRWSTNQQLCPCRPSPTDHTVACCKFLGTLVTQLEAMTKASSSGKASATCLDCLGEAVDLLRVVCVSIASWYLGLTHLCDCAILQREVSRLLLWALAYTRQPHLHTLSAATKSAITRAGVLCLRIFEGLPPGMLPAAVCKLPPALIPALACFMCEQMASPEAQERLKQEMQDVRSMTKLIAQYLLEDVGGSKRAVSKALLSPPLLDWAQLELVAKVTPPSRSAAAAQQRASAAAPPACSLPGFDAWGRFAVFYAFAFPGLPGQSPAMFSAPDCTETQHLDLSARSKAIPAELLRALRIVAWNAFLYGADRGDVQRTRDRSLQHQSLVLGSWKGQIAALGRRAAKGKVNMVLGMAAFSATAVFAVLCEAGPRDDIVGALLRNARICITEMNELRLEHLKGRCIGGAGSASWLACSTVCG